MKLTSEVEQDEIIRLLMESVEEAKKMKADKQKELREKFLKARRRNDD